MAKEQLSRLQLAIERDLWDSGDFTLTMLQAPCPMPQKKTCFLSRETRFFEIILEVFVK